MLVVSRVARFLAPIVLFFSLAFTNSYAFGRRADAQVQIEYLNLLNFRLHQTLKEENATRFYEIKRSLLDEVDLSIIDEGPRKVLQTLITSITEVENSNDSLAGYKTALVEHRMFETVAVGYSIAQKLFSDDPEFASFVSDRPAYSDVLDALSDDMLAINNPAFQRVKQAQRVRLEDLVLSNMIELQAAEKTNFAELQVQLLEAFAPYVKALRNDAWRLSPLQFDQFEEALAQTDAEVRLALFQRMEEQMLLFPPFRLALAQTYAEIGELDKSVALLFALSRVDSALRHGYYQKQALRDILSISPDPRTRSKAALQLLEMQLTDADVAALFVEFAQSNQKRELAELLPLMKKSNSRRIVAALALKSGDLNLQTFKSALSLLPSEPAIRRAMRALFSSKANFLEPSDLVQGLLNENYLDDVFFAKLPEWLISYDTATADLEGLVLKAVKVPGEGVKMFGNYGLARNDIIANWQEGQKLTLSLQFDNFDLDVTYDRLSKEQFILSKFCSVLGCTSGQKPF